MLRWEIRLVSDPTFLPLLTSLRLADKERIYLRLYICLRFSGEDGRGGVKRSGRGKAGGGGWGGVCTSHAIPPCVVVGYDEEFCEMKDNFSRDASE